MSGALPAQHTARSAPLNLEALGWRRTRNNLEEYHAVYYVLLQGIILEGLWRAQPN